MPTNSLRPLRWLLAWSLICAVTISAPALAKTPALVVIGDSLSAGYGMRAEQGWVHLLSERLRERAAPYQVVNASISGDTSRGGSARLGILLKKFDISIAIVELGGNDGLRGIDLAQLAIQNPIVIRDSTPLVQHAALQQISPDDMYATETRTEPRIQNFQIGTEQ